LKLLVALEVAAVLQGFCLLNISTKHGTFILGKRSEGLCWMLAEARNRGFDFCYVLGHHVDSGLSDEAFKLAALALIATELPYGRLRPAARADGVFRVVESLSLRLLNGLTVPACPLAHLFNLSRPANVHLSRAYGERSNVIGEGKGRARADAPERRAAS
jgi:hypothetical protein